MKLSMANNGFRLPSAGGRLIAACALVMAVATALLLALNNAKIESTLEKRIQERQQLVVGELAKALDAHLALGLPVDDTPALRSLLDRTRTADPLLFALLVIEPGGDSTLVSGQGNTSLWQSAFSKARRASAPAYVRDGSHGAIALPLRDAYNLPGGFLVAEFDLVQVRAQSLTTLKGIAPPVALALMVALLILAVGGQRILRSAGQDKQRINRRLGALVTTLVLSVQAVIAWNAYAAFERIARDDAQVLASTFSHTVRPGLERALSAGIALPDLVGVKQWLTPMLGNGGSFSAVEIREPASGRVLHEAHLDRPPPPDRGVKFTFPIEQAETLAGYLIVHLDLTTLAERSRQLSIEFVTLMIAGAFLVQEALRLLNKSRADGTQGELQRLRAPLFMFFFASELPRSFLPVWGRELAARPLPDWLTALTGANELGALSAVPDTVLATLPISVFLLSVALSSPMAGRICSARGPGRLMHFGLGIAMAGHLMAFVSDSLLVLCLARIMAGISFGCLSIAAFDVIGRQTTGRASGMGTYLAAYMAGGVCGSGLGALLADRSGFSSVFPLALACCLVAVILARRSWGGASATIKGVKPTTGILAGLLRQPSFVRLLVLLALPMQMVQQGLLFYWAPLALVRLGESASFVGLAMMGYFLLVLFVAGPIARYADRMGHESRLTELALFASGIAAIAGGVFHSPLVIAAAILLVGLAWATGFPALGSVALQMCQKQLNGVEPAVAMGVYRSIERVGAMLAPMLAAFLVVALNFEGAAMAMGGLMMVCALANAAWFRRAKSS